MPPACTRDGTLSEAACPGGRRKPGETEREHPPSSSQSVHPVPDDGCVAGRRPSRRGEVRQQGLPGAARQRGDGVHGLAGGGRAKIYLASEDGDVSVVKSGAMFEVLSRNAMGEICMAAPAISAGVLHFRTQSHVVTIASRR